MNTGNPAPWQTGCSNGALWQTRTVPSSLASTSPAISAKRGAWETSSSRKPLTREAPGEIGRDPGEDRARELAPGQARAEPAERDDERVGTHQRRGDEERENRRERDASVDQGDHQRHDPAGAQGGDQSRRHGDQDRRPPVTDQGRPDPPVPLERLDEGGEEDAGQVERPQVPRLFEEEGADDLQVVDHEATGTDCREASSSPWRRCT